MSKANRSKAGVKSASSQFAAELLSTSEVTTFDTLTAPACSVQDSLDIIAIKKLAKRDSSSREKALRDLIDRAVEGNEDAVFSAFSNLSPNLDKLIFDCSPTVRTLILRLLSKQIALLRKRVEKEVINALPYVYLASCDGYGPCSTEAAALLSSLFTAEKRLSVLKMSMPRVLRVVEEVVEGTSSLLVPSKVANKEVEDTVEERTGRISDQCFYLLATLIHDVGSEEAEELVCKALKKCGGKKMSRALLCALAASERAVQSVSSSAPSWKNVLSNFRDPSDPVTLGVCLDIVGKAARKDSFTQLVPTLTALCKGMEKWKGVVWSKSEGRAVSLFKFFVSSSSTPSQTMHSLLSSIINKEDLSLERSRVVCECVLFVLHECEKMSAADKEDAMSMWLSAVEEWTTLPHLLPPFSAFLSRHVQLLEDTAAEEFLSRLSTSLLSKMPSSSSFLFALLSLHHPSLLSVWLSLHLSHHPLPLPLLLSMSEEQLHALQDRLDVLQCVEESGDVALLPVYEKLLPHARQELHASDLLVACLRGESPALFAHSTLSPSAVHFVVETAVKERDADLLAALVVAAPSTTETVHSLLIAQRLPMQLVEGILTNSQFPSTDTLSSELGVKILNTVLDGVKEGNYEVGVDRRGR